MSTSIIAGILIAGIVILFLQCIFIIGVLSRIHGVLQVIAQVVAVGIQRAGLVRTPEEAEADAREAEEEDEDLKAMQAEIEKDKDNVF